MRRLKGYRKRVTVQAWREAVATAIQAALPEETKVREYRGERLFPAYSVYNGWPASDGRFELVFEPFPKCSSRQLYPVKPRTKPTPIFALKSVFFRQDYRRCRGKPTIKLNGKWLCARCSKEQPTPMWDEAELLHLRPMAVHSQWVRFQMRKDPNGETLSQGQAQEFLGLDHEGLWKAMVGWPHIPTCGGGERKPYRFCPVLLALAKEVLAQDAANRLLGEHSWRAFRDRPQHFAAAMR